MKIIFLENVSNIGKKLEIKNVKPGYARNFLMPKKLAVPAIKKNLIWREKKIVLVKIEEKKVIEKLKKVIEKLKKVEIKIPVKVGLKKELFEKIKEVHIAKALKGKGFDVKKDNIKLKKPLVKIGKYGVTVQLAPEIKTDIKIEVVKESKKIVKKIVKKK